MQLGTPEYCYILDMCALPDTSRCGLQDYLRTYYYLLVSNPLGSSVLEGRCSVIILYCYCIMFQCTIWIHLSQWLIRVSNWQFFFSCRISLKGQRSTVPGRTNISHLGKFGTSSNSNVPFLVGEMWSFPGGYQFTWYYLFFWTSKPLGFPNLVEHYLLSCSPFETSAIQNHWFAGLCSTGTHPTATCHHCWDNLQVPVRPSIQVEILKMVVETGYIRWSLDFG